MLPQYGEPRPSSGWDRFTSLGHPCRFQRVSRLGSVTAATSLTGGQPNSARCLAISWAATLYMDFRGSCPLTEFCRAIIFLPCSFFLSIFYLFFPRLISAATDWMSTIHMSTYTWPGPSVNLECRSEMCCSRLAANTGRKKSPSRHHRTTLSGHIFATNACIDNRKKTC